MDSCFSERLKAVYEKNKNLYLKVTFHFVQDYSNAEDIVHDAIVGLIHKYGETGGLENEEIHYYLLTAVRNRSLSFLKRKQPLVIATDEYIYISAEDVETAAMDEVWLAETLKQLPEEHKNLLIWKYYYGMTNVEISEKLHISPQSFNMTMKRAKEKFHQACSLGAENTDD